MGFFETGDRSRCCGCSACMNICGQSAIHLINDEEGFLYPEIEEDKCVHCGLCERVCPMGEYYNFEPDYSVEVYAAYDAYGRVGSSSGGVFYTLAEYVINERKGWVFGAAFDSDMKLRHIGVNKMEDIAPLRGSKYLQSDTQDSFGIIRDLLKNGVFVLFAGTPCQVAGLRSFLRKQYDNLLLVDVVCHGVPSQLMFDEHRNYLEKEHHSRLVKYQFRDNDGWGGCEIADFKNGKRISHSSYDISPYLYSFMHGYTCRESCYSCPFAKVPRQGDITLGDYWGVRNHFPAIDFSKGVSLVTINTKIGQAAWDSICDNLVYLKSNIEDASKANSNLIESSTRPVLRTGIYGRIKKEGYSSIVEQEFRHPNYQQLIFREKVKKNRWMSFVIRNLKRLVGRNGHKPKETRPKANIITIHTGFNFGSVLQTIASVRFLASLGLDPIVVNYIQPSYTIMHFLKKGKGSVLNLLRMLHGFPTYLRNLKIYNSYLSRFCNLTKPIYRDDDFTSKCPMADYYITGSDQVWNTSYNGMDMRYFYAGIKNGVKLSLSASIGKDSPDEETLTMLREGLKNYSFISVREQSAVNILSSLGFESSLLLDPTFLLSKDDWRTFETKNRIKVKYLLLYLPYNIHDKKLIFDTARIFANKRGLKVVTFSWGSNNEPLADITVKFCSPGDFLTLMAHADIIITNSFHGTAFSINLNKQFWVYMPTSFSTRIESILSLVGLSGRLLNDMASEEQIEESIEYDSVNKILEEERKKARYFMINAIRKGPQKSI